jgi:hypothetical protein
MRGDEMIKQKVPEDTSTIQEKGAKGPKESNDLGVCEKAFSPESARLKDKDEPCEDGIQR